MSIERIAPRQSLVDVLDRVLDKGLVIDVSVKVSLIGIEIVGIDAQIVVGSIQTYDARFSTAAENRTTAPPARRRPAVPAGTPRAGRRPRRQRMTVNARCEHGCTFVMRQSALPSTVTCPFDGSRTCSVAAPAA